MKKVFSVLTVAVLAVSTVFAGFSGSASIGAGANFDNGNYGFLSQGSGVDVNVELTTANGEAKGEGDVYASIKGSLSVTLLNDEAENDAFTAVYRDSAVGILASVDEAKIAGENWSVSILGMPGAPDYAKSAIDSFPVDAKDAWGRVYDTAYAPVSYKSAYAKTNGVTVDVFGYKAGIGLLGDFAKEKENNLLDFSAFVETPEYNFSGVTVQAGLAYSKNEAKLDKKGIVVADTETHDLGISAKVGYANDKISASVATDMGINLRDSIDLAEIKDGDEVVRPAMSIKIKDIENDRIKNLLVFNTDLAVNFKYDFVSASLYYATLAAQNENLLSAKVAVDLNSLDVPVALTFAAKDLIAKQDLSLKADVTVIDGLTLTAKGGYIVDTTGRTDADPELGVKFVIDDDIDADHKNVGKWSAGLDAKYEHEMFTAKAGMSLAQVVEEGSKLEFGASASVETEALVPGAKLGLAWSGAKDLLKNDAKDDNNFGKLMASCTIEF